MTVPAGVKTLVKLGNEEENAGLTYVTLARNVGVRDLCIGNAITLQRLRAAISGFTATQGEDERLQRLQVETTTLYSL